MVEVTTGHTKAGNRAVQNAGSGTSRLKDLFPDDWSDAQIESRIREAFKNANERLKVQRNPLGEVRHRIRGDAGGYRIEMWYNATTKTIETAYPKGKAQSH